MKLSHALRAKLDKIKTAPPAPARAQPRATPARGELLRVMSLPRRAPPDLESVLDLSAQAGAPARTLRPIQSWALAELRERGGVVLPMGVGAGKTLVALLAPWALGVPLAEVMFCVPPSLRETFVAEAAKWAEVFSAAPSAEEVQAQLVAYSDLSKADNADLLQQRRPRLIVLDEAHTVARKTSARGARFSAYMAKHPDTHLVVMSGTLLSSSLEDLAALASMALGQGSPLPLVRDDLRAWCDVTDSERSKGNARPVGPGDKVWRRWTAALPDVLALTVKGRRRAIRAWVLERIRETPGIVSTVQTSATYPCELTPLALEVHPEVAEALELFEASCVLPDGREVDRSAEAAVIKRGLRLGHFNHWRWSDVEDAGWLAARRAYFRELGAVVSKRRRGLDSALLVREALEAGRDLGPELGAAWAAWVEIEPRASVESIPAVLTLSPLRHLLGAWAAMRPDNSPAIIWYWHRAEAAMLEALGYNVIWPGQEAPPNPRAGDVVAMSIRGHGTGKQLQDWPSALILTPPSSGKLWEQLLGRQNRGEPVDSHPGVVRVWVVDQGQLAAAEHDARFAHQTQGQEQRLLTADKKSKITIKMS